MKPHRKCRTCRAENEQRPRGDIGNARDDLKIVGWERGKRVEVRASHLNNSVNWFSR